jgi:hypothetical protein
LSVLGLVLVAAIAAAAMAALTLRTQADPVLSAGAPARAPKPTSEAAPPAPPPPRLFGADSFWNRRLGADAPVDPASPSLVAALTAEIAREQAATIGPWISGVFTSPLYRVTRSQRRVRVSIDERTSPGAAALRRAMAHVPIPRHAQPASGPDRHMTIWQPSTDTMWELYRARRRADGWHANWGGAIRHVSKSRGYYSPSAWPGATYNWGGTASSLPVTGGTIMAAELAAGLIDHALALNVPASRAGVFSWPAQRTDGTGSATTLPEGARLRLDPSLDISSLGLPKLARMIARAAQRYGIVVRDQTGHATTFFVQNPAQLPARPYDALYRGRTPAQLLARFPWNRLQVLRMSLCTRAPCRRAG